VHAAPAVSNCALTAESPRVRCKPHRYAGRSRAILAGQVQAIRTLATVENKIGHIEPPRRISEPFKRLRNFLLSEHRFIGLSRFGPGAARVRFVAGNAFLWPGEDHGAGKRL
jgi:hypothetical protein